MSAMLAAPARPAVPAAGRSAALRRVRIVAFGRRYARNRAALVGLALVVGLVGAALLADVVSPFDPQTQFAEEALQAPSARHLFGTDQIGRDQLARVIFGARASISVGVLSMLFAGLPGTSLGLLAGYYGGRLDSVIMRLMDGLLAFPALLLAIFIVAVLGPSILNAVLAVAIVNIPSFARLTRAQVLSVREKEFVESSRALGASNAHIMLATILPNCLSPLIVQFTLGIGLGILVEAGLSFLGLGVRPPTPAWGSMLSATWVGRWHRLPKNGGWRAPRPSSS